MVSAFSKKVVKPLKLMMRNEKCIGTFAFIEEAEISSSSSDALVEFVCELYHHKENSTDYVR